MKLWGLYRRFPYLEHRHHLISQLPPHASLLEIGSSNCDRAKLFKHLRPDLNVFATDREDYSASAGDQLSFFVADITKSLPEELEGRFDCVTTMHLFEHLDPHDYAAALAEIKKVLKPGGLWYIEAPGLRSLCLPSLSLGRGRFSGPINFYDDPTHIKPFTEGGLYYLLTNNGFIVRRTGIARNLLLMLLSPILIIAGLLSRKRSVFTIGLFHLVGWSVYASGIKKREHE